MSVNLFHFFNGVLNLLNETTGFLLSSYTLRTFLFFFAVQLELTVFLMSLIGFYRVLTVSGVGLQVNPENSCQVCLVDLVDSAWSANAGNKPPMVPAYLLKTVVYDGSNGNNFFKV